MLSRLARVSAVFALLAALASGCNCSTTQTAKIKPGISVNPTTLDFGPIAVGDTSEPQTVTLQAVTAAAVSITELSITTIGGAGGNAFSLQGMAPTSIDGRSSLELAVLFKPSAVDTYAGELTFKTNDASNATVKILLTGEGKSPQISVTPDHLGLTAVACPAQAMSARCRDQTSVTVQNVGMVNLTLQKVDIEATDASTPLPANLRLTQQVSTSSLASGDMLTVGVSWIPHGDVNPANAEVGDFTANLVITSNDPAKPVIKVPIAAHADPAQLPTACLNVLQVQQRQYVASTNGGQPQLTYANVPATRWRDTTDPTTIHVRPGEKITLTSRRVKYNATTDLFELDPSGEQMMPCTADPQGDVLTRTWALTGRPQQSHANVNPTNQGTDSVIELDAVGSYGVGLKVADSLNLTAQAALNIDAQPQDDLFAELDWQQSPGIDLDLHLLVDNGPTVGNHMAQLFCYQDCFFFNQSPDWFMLGADKIPHLLRDDQGNAGQIESTDLVKAPPGSSFRVAVHYYGGTGSVTPTVTLRHLSTTLGTFTPSMPLTNPNDVWYAARVDFPTDGTAPTATALGTIETNDAPPPLTYDNVGMCP